MRVIAGRCGRWASLGCVLAAGVGLLLGAGRAAADEGGALLQVGRQFDAARERCEADAPAKKAGPGRGIIVDSHIHLWDLPRSGPVKPDAVGALRSTTLQDASLFPEDCCAGIAPFWIQDFLMSHYDQTPGGRKVGKVVLVEALPGISTKGLDVAKQVEGNQWMLDQAKQDCKVLSVVGLLDVTQPPSVFQAAFDKLKGDKKFVGIRVRGFYVANADNTFKHFAPNFIANMRTMVRAGLTAFDIPEGDTHPTATVALAKRFPKAHFIVNHYANYGERTQPIGNFVPQQAWIDHLELQAAEPNVLVKVGFITQIGALEPFWPWPFKASEELEKYEPILDELLNAFGPNRLLFESNWPTSERAARGDLPVETSDPGPGGPYAGWRDGGADTIDLQIRIMENWLKDKRPSVRDRIMGGNALRVYAPRER
jgi:predicted TIM-barrel fold metal-dependent hydrolase